METVFHDLIEEYQSEDIMSVNHSKIIHRLSIALDRYNSRFDILPELELQLSTGKCKPDVCVYPLIPDDWENDIIYYSQPPIIAIEVVSPRQAIGDIVDKMNTLYLPADVPSIWIIIPSLQQVNIRTNQGHRLTFTEGVIVDPITDIEIPFDLLFGKN